LLILLLVGSNAIERGAISIADFIALILYVERLVFPTALLGFAITTFQRGEVSIERVESILIAEPLVQDAGDAIALPPELVVGKITARNLCYTHPGTDTPALDGIDFEIAPVKRLRSSPIGAGKSTLVNALPRLLDIAPGQLFLDDRDVTQIRLRDLREAIAYVPQDSFLFSATVNNNIRYGQPLAEPDEVEQVAKQAQIHPEIINFPRQYETLVGERGITLSGGQRQRTSLARALLVSAPVIVLDDALSSVDNQTATEILNSFTSAQEQTVIFISHQLAAAATADRIFVMDKGKIVQIGTHEQLSQRPGLYQFLWEQQQLEKVLQ
ncbi:MAG: ABC transporter ATP-binding protein, partial [Spirulinaceae cyanobacterium RM2_2_10]|nr:ABC transporter ATP-binding protein [Spirulinaceae cyanobacterium RM2_2_10]